MSTWGSKFFSKKAEPVIPVESEGVTPRPSSSQPTKSSAVTGTVQKDTISIQRTNTTTARKKLYDKPAIPTDSKSPFSPPATSNSNAGRVAKMFGYATPDPVPASTPASEIKSIPEPKPIPTPAPPPAKVEIKAVPAPKPKPEPAKPTEQVPAPAPSAGRIAKLFGYGTSTPTPAPTTTTTAAEPSIKLNSTPPPKAPAISPPKEVAATPPTKLELETKLPTQTPIPITSSPTEIMQNPNPNAGRLANLFGYASPPPAPAPAPVSEVQAEDNVASVVGVKEDRISPAQAIALAKFQREQDLKNLNGDGDRPIIVRANTLQERTTSQPYTPNPSYRTRRGGSASSAELKLLMSNREVQASQEESLYRERRIREHQRQAERIAVQKEMMEVERRRIMEESEKWREQEREWKEEEEEMRRFVEEVRREREREEMEEERRSERGVVGRDDRSVRERSVERVGGGGRRIPGAFDEESGFGDPAIQGGMRDRDNRDDDRVSKKEAERLKRLKEYEEQVELERLRYEEEEAEERAQRRREEQEEEEERLREEEEEEARAQKRRDDRIAKEKRRAEKEREEQRRYEQEEAEEQRRYEQEEAEEQRRLEEERQEQLRFEVEEAERMEREREEELRYQREEAERVQREREREEQLRFEQDEAIRLAEEKLARERKQRRIEAERVEEARRQRYQQEQAQQEEDDDDDDDQPLTKEQELAKAEEKIRAAFAGLAQERSGLAQQAAPQQAPTAFPISSATPVPRQDERRPSISSNSGRSIRPGNRGTRTERGGQSVDIKMGRDRDPEVGVARFNTVGARSNGPPRGLPNGPRGGVGLPGGPRAGLPNGPRPRAKA